MGTAAGSGIDHAAVLNVLARGQAKREAIVSFLRRKASDCRKHAGRLLADTMLDRVYGMLRRWGQELFLAILQQLALTPALTKKVQA